MEMVDRENENTVRELENQQKRYVRQSKILHERENDEVDERVVNVELIHDERLNVEEEKTKQNGENKKMKIFLLLLTYTS